MLTIRNNVPYNIPMTGTHISNNMGAIVIQDIVIKYDGFAAEEDMLIQRIGVCNECIEVILKYVSDKVDPIHILTAEDIVTAIHRIGQDLDTELLHVRLEKSLLERKFNSQQT
jgi:hypothetical protein